MRKQKTGKHAVGHDVVYPLHAGQPGEDEHDRRAAERQHQRQAPIRTATGSVDQRVDDLDRQRLDPEAADQGGVT